MIAPPVLTDDERNAMEKIEERVTERRDAINARGKRCLVITKGSVLYLEGYATVRGSDNVVHGFHCMIECRNSKIVGDRFVIKGSNNVAWGNNLKVTGLKHKIYGNNCTINASDCEVYGDNNIIIGNNNLVVGESCETEGDGNVCRLPQVNNVHFDSDDEDLGEFAHHIQNIIAQEDEHDNSKRRRVQREVSVIKPDPNNKVLTAEQEERLIEKQEEEEKSFKERQEKGELKEDEKEPKTFICKICESRKVDTVITPCMHAQFCSHCVQACEDKANNFFRQCPSCRTEYLTIVGMKIFT